MLGDGKKRENKHNHMTQQKLHYQSSELSPQINAAFEGILDFLSHTYKNTNTMCTRGFGENENFPPM